MKVRRIEDKNKMKVVGTKTGEIRRNAFFLSHFANLLVIFAFFVNFALLV